MARKKSKEVKKLPVESFCGVNLGYMQIYEDIYIVYLIFLSYDTEKTGTLFKRSRRNKDASKLSGSAVVLLMDRMGLRELKKIIDGIMEEFNLRDKNEIQIVNQWRFWVPDFPSSP
jgi:hypothetical protein